MVSLSDTSASTVRGAGGSGDAGTGGAAGGGSISSVALLVSVAVAAGCCWLLVAVSGIVCGTACGCAGALPLPSHTALRIRMPNDFDAGVTFKAYSLASMPFGNWMR